MISIIIPTLNEEEGIAKVLCSIPEDIKKEAEIIVVDVSTDMTPIIAEKLGARVIKSDKKGKGWQMRLGVKESKGDILVFLDGDGTDPAYYLPKLLEELKNCDLVLGCRSLKKFLEDDKKMRRFFKMYIFFVIPIFRLIGFKINGDPFAGFRVIRKKDWEKLDLKSDDFKIETEMNIKAMKEGFVIKTVPIPHLKRCGGGLRTSKFAFNFQQYFEIAKLLFQYFKEEKIKIKTKKLREKIKSAFKG